LQTAQSKEERDLGRAAGVEKGLEIEWRGGERGALGPKICWLFFKCQSPSSLSHLLSFFLGPYVHYFYNAETKNNDTQLLSFEAFYFSPFLFTLEEKKP